MTDSLTRRIEAFLEVEEIKRPKHRYLRAVDTRGWEALRSCLTPDAGAGYGNDTATTPKARPRWACTPGAGTW